MRNEVNSFEEKDTIAKTDAKLAKLIGELAEKLKSDVYSVQRKSQLIIQGLYWTYLPWQ